MPVSRGYEFVSTLASSKVSGGGIVSLPRPPRREAVSFVWTVRTTTVMGSLISRTVIVQMSVNRG
tara:strand:- start:1130 stop:1324 length:195 start_codon:yes stop_codon:yes gene_type:complete